LWPYNPNEWLPRSRQRRCRREDATKQTFRRLSIAVRAKVWAGSNAAYGTIRVRLARVADAHWSGGVPLAQTYRQD